MEEHQTKEWREEHVDCPDNEFYLKEFIRTWESCPEIWKNSCDEYRNKCKKNKAWDKLLSIYINIKPDSTRYDVKRKLNSLRTNFRRERKRVLMSRSSGGPEYTPTNWKYNKLLFLCEDFEEPDLEHANTSERKEQRNRTEERNYSSDTDKNSESSVELFPSASGIKRIKRSEYEIAVDKGSSENQQEEDHLAKVWAKKLKQLDPSQKLYAEKAINDILFEAQLENLRYRKDF